MMTERLAKFSIGELVHHRLFDYRGVIMDVDPVFLGTEEWYEQVAKSGPPKDKPWYHVLVHNANHQTYVAERNLEPDPAPAPVEHPMVGHLLGAFDGQAYRVRGDRN